MPSPKIYSPTGELTITTATAFKTALVDMISDGQSVTLDLAGVRRIDVAALQVMIAAERTGRIVLRNPSQSVMKAMEVIGFTPTSVPSYADSNGMRKIRKTARDTKRLRKRQTGSMEQ